MTDPVGEYGPAYVVERLRATLEEELSQEFLNRINIDTIHDRIANRIRFRLRTEVWGERLAPEVTHHHTLWHETRWATWWDHLKDTYRSRWWLAWLVRRRPVRYVDIPHLRDITLTVESYRKYPEANFRVPDDFGPVVYEQGLYTEESWHPW